MASPSVVPRKLWEHPNPDATQMSRFIRKVNDRRGLSLKVSKYFRMGLLLATSRDVDAGTVTQLRNIDHYSALLSPLYMKELPDIGAIYR